MKHVSWNIWNQDFSGSIITRYRFNELIIRHWINYRILETAFYNIEYKKILQIKTGYKYFNFL